MFHKDIVRHIAYLKGSWLFSTSDLILLLNLQGQFI